MIKPPFQEQQIIEILNVYFGISIYSAQLIQGGADMNSFGYKADSPTQSYFVKLKCGKFDEMNLSIICLLQDSGVKEIIVPLPTLDAKLFQKIDHVKIIVYPFIQAPNGFARNLTKKHWYQFGKVLRQIHDTSLPSWIKQQLRKEMYSSQWRDIVRSFYSKMSLEPSDNKITTDFKSFFNQHIYPIQQLVDSSEVLSKKINPDIDEYVLCHSDIHAGNVLVVNEEAIYIIDWDEPILAPKERDLMFIGGGVGNVWNAPHEVPFFYEGYGCTIVDKTILSYYRQERIIEDIAVYGQDLLSRTQNDQSRLESFKYFKEMFNPNNVVEIALTTEQY
ncbi:phosphotransferase family protein [Legionella sp. WA2022007384]